MRSGGLVDGTVVFPFRMCVFNGAAIVCAICLAKHVEYNVVPGCCREGASQLVPGQVKVVDQDCGQPSESAVLVYKLNGGGTSEN